ncbi:autotransporter outer membrane beta-barrel domain-containing protein [Succinispira mobilis]|uniref:autotransporter outer membrane beta-barrel domain-containing protein n=1 Tax=Succinispira mobilis TaxID=78120 RepID=UPI000360A75D|nr:autotransporter outer membrane beta-barrel domain-containing protein [Succinispira mobilis]
MKRRNKKKQLACALQAMCLGGVLLAADPAAVCEAATIITTQTYSNQSPTITDDINITDGYISVSGYNGSDTVNLTGQNIYINQGSSAYALLAKGVAGGCASGYGVLRINTNDSSTVRIIGNVETAPPDGCATGRIYLYLTNADSFLAGMPIQGSGSINLSFTNGATWYIPEDVNTFTGTREGGVSVSAVGGNIDIYHTRPGTVRSAAVGTRTFSAAGADNTGEGSLSLNGATFALSSDIKNNLTDKVVLTKVSGNPLDIVGAGWGRVNNYALQIVYDPAMSKDGTYTASDLTILTTDNTGDTVTAKDYLTTRTEAAGLKTVNIKLTPTLSTSGGVTKLTALTVKNTDSAGPAATMASAASAAQMAALGAWRAENNDLQRRLGDLRWDEGNAGAWARAYGGKSQIHSGAGSEISYHGIQVGYDRARTIEEGRIFTGIAVSNMKGDASGTAGRSDLDSKLFGIYGSYVGKSGHFIDAIVKYGRFTNDTNRTHEGINYAGDYGTNGLNMSLEYGYHQQLHNGFYLEPQAEVNYSHLNSSSYTMNAGGTSGAFVRNSGVDSLIARVGVNAGRNTKNGNIYLKLSCLHEFNGDTGMTANYNGTTVSSDSSGSDTWIEYGVGFNQRIGQSQNLYGEITRSACADKVSDDWKANLGWRVSF